MLEKLSDMGNSIYENCKEVIDLFINILCIFGYILLFLSPIFLYFLIGILVWYGIDDWIALNTGITWIGEIPIYVVASIIFLLNYIGGIFKINK